MRYGGFMNILGIHVRGHDQGAFLVQDGKLLCGVEEERLERFKHGSTNPHQKGVPENSINFCLEHSGLKMRDIDYITLPVNSKDTFKKIPKAVWNSRNFYLRGGIWGGSVFGILFKFAWWDDYIANTGLRYIKRKYGYLPKVRFIEHHTSHAASAFRCSGFDKANVITLDGIGGLTSISMKVGNGKEMETIKEIMYPNSLGALYGSVTEILGFQPGADEGKIQALASYGKPVVDFSDVVKTKKGDFKLDLDRLIAKFPKMSKNPLTETHKNIAASLQEKLEESVLNLVEYMYEITGYKKLCLAGGVALNSSMNGILLQSDFVDDIFIQPIAGDNGSILGGALELAKTKIKMEHAYWGPQYSNEEIEKQLKECKLKYDYYSDICGEVAELLAKGKICGWHQGKCELGPRALGGRSILADPSNPKMKDKVNNEVKHREPWRPFAPSILAESTDDYLVENYPTPFMILCFRIKEEKINEVISATHVDKTARPQSVERKQSPKYYKLIKDFSKETGIPAVLNTSFNFRGEPIVCSPRDSIRTFMGTGMDYMAIGDFLVRKK
jgi:carbamoyltransferase